MRLERVLTELPAGSGLLRLISVRENALALSLTLTPDDVHELDAACPRPSR